MMLRGMFALLAIAMLGSCANQGSSGEQISGTIKGAEGETLMLYRFVSNRPVVTDSIKIAEDGSFAFTPSKAMELNFYQLALDQERSVVFITDSTEQIHIEADATDMAQTASFEGSKHSELLDQFQDQIRPIEKQMNELRQISKDKTIAEEERSQAFGQVVDLTRQRREMAVNFIETNSTSPAALAALAEININQDIAYYEKVNKDLKTGFGHSYYYKMIDQQIQHAKQPKTAQQSNQKNSKYTVGMDAPDIRMKNPEGQELSLHDLKGKVVMIDFWASWCGPCRRENPNVVAAYNKYNKDGFEIFSVSLDKDANKWQTAIAQDGLLWPNHVSDLQGWNNAASREYGVSSIPHTILVGRDGKIIGTHLRGPALEAKLAEIFEG